MRKLRHSYYDFIYFIKKAYKHVFRRKSCDYPYSWIKKEEELK